MPEFPHELRQRLVTLRAYLSLELQPPRSPVRDACDVLEAAIDTPSTIELAGESPTKSSPRELNELATRMLHELGIPPTAPEGSVWLVAQDIAERMMAGQMPPEDGSHELLGLLTEHGDRELIDQLIEATDDWEWMSTTGKSAADIRWSMQGIARRVTHIAQAKLEQLHRA